MAEYSALTHCRPSVLACFTSLVGSLITARSLAFSPSNRNVIAGETAPSTCCAIDSRIRRRVKSGAFAEDWHALRERWHLACDVTNGPRGRRNMPLNEAEYAGSQCISLALEVPDAEDAATADPSVPFSLEQTRGWVFERFRTSTPD